jgi:hypothetical protein
MEGKRISEKRRVISVKMEAGDSAALAPVLALLVEEFVSAMALFLFGVC